MSKPKLSIIIVNWNTQALLKQCLDSITGEYHRYHKYHKYHKQGNDLSLEVIIVDNGSNDDSVDVIQKSKLKYQNQYLEFKIILNTENLGFGKANNQGIKVATGDYIMLLNSDTIVKAQAIELLVEYLNTHPATAVVGPKLLNADGTSQANCGHFPNLFVSFIMLFVEKLALKEVVRYSPNTVTTVDWLMGAAVLARREVFDKIGGLDEGIFMYMEEVEWFYRVNRGGYKVEFYPKSEITHLGRGSSKSGRKDPILNIYRGLIHFYKKHYSKTSLILLLTMLKLKALLSYILGIMTNNYYLKDTYAQALKIS